MKNVLIINQLDKMNKDKLFKQLNNEVKKKLDKYKSPLDFFINLKKYSFSRLELMIIDSSIKNFPLSNMHNTLLLKEYVFLNYIKEIIGKLKKIKL